jgi:methionine-gamma-lyase
MEGTETANVSASGMGAITLRYCNCAVEITLFLQDYIWRYLCFLEKLYAAFWYKTSFVDITKLDIVEAAITADTKVLY